MSTLQELVAHRAAAGAAYATAFANFKAAYIDLDATDRALANGKVAYAQAIPGFGGVRIWDGIEKFMHSTYLPNPKGDWEPEITAALVTKVNAYPTAD